MAMLGMAASDTDSEYVGASVSSYVPLPPVRGYIPAVIYHSESPD